MRIVEVYCTYSTCLWLMNVARTTVYQICGGAGDKRGERTLFLNVRLPSSKRTMRFTKNCNMCRILPPKKRVRNGAYRVNTLLA